jgi:hypothetical protein
MRRSYKNGWHDEKNNFADAYSIWMCAWVKDLVKRYALEAREKAVRKLDGAVCRIR